MNSITMEIVRLKEFSPKLLLTKNNNYDLDKLILFLDIIPIEHLTRKIHD